MREDAVGLDMHWITLDDPGVAVKSAALVPPAFHGFGIDAHHQRIKLVAIGDVRRQVDIDRVITAPVAVDERAIEPHGGKGGDGVQLQFDMLAVVLRLEAQHVAIPDHAPAAVALIDIAALLDRLEADKVVRQGDRLPCTVVEFGRSRSARCAGFGQAL